MDGQVFVEAYLTNVSSGTHLEALDYRLDAKFFNDWFRDVSLVPGIPDYPMDGEFFVDHYSELE
jgi:hypothetical protein